MIRFLGGVPFAVMLISLTATGVIAGTFLESYADSHGFASAIIYSSLFFNLLICGFFINILVSALRRYPFKPKHIPFLITHLGLLMILAGTLVKNTLGTQGSLSILEGGASRALHLSDTYALRIDSKKETRILPLKNKQLKDSHYTLKQWLPHVHEKLKGWILGDTIRIFGFPPVQVHTWEPSQQLPNVTPFRQWNLLALRTDAVPEALERAYHRDLAVNIPGVTFDFDFHYPKGFQNPKMIYEGQKIALSGPQALLNSFGIDLKRPQLLLLIEDSHGDITLSAFDNHGRVFSEIFLQSKIPSLIAYDQGYLGYGLLSKIPFWTFPSGRQELEKARKQILEDKLRKNTAPLSPPLQLLSQACEKSGVDFPSTCLDFLTDWYQTRSWLFPNRSLGKVYDSIDFSSMPANELKAAKWCCRLFDSIEPEIKRKKDLIDILNQRNWPLIDAMIAFRGKKGPVAPGELPKLLTWMTQEMFTVGDLLPDPPDEPAPERILSAYMRVYEIHLETIHHFENLEEVDTALRLINNEPASFPILLETPLIPVYTAVPPPLKMEERRPMITLSDGSKLIHLGFDPSGKGLKWPIENGEKMIRFQPEFLEIPYEVRIRQARQINYPNSNQPHSYEAEVLITELKTAQIAETTLKMNKVYETWDGYRFYLSGMSPGDESKVKQVQIVVNHDPVKYFLTYPGALILALGIILLFWFRKT